MTYIDLNHYTYLFLWIWKNFCITFTTTIITLSQSLGVPKSNAEASIVQALTDYRWFVNASHQSQDKGSRINIITSNLVHERKETLSICNW